MVINNLNVTNNLSVMNDHIRNILISISQNPVINVTSLSGSGKTTLLPIGIAKAGNRIVVVVRDKSIAVSLSKYVDSITSPKIIVGTNLNTGSNITYIDSRTLKKYLYDLIRNDICIDLDFADVLMIDEADSQTIDQYMITSIWRYCVENKSRVPHLLLVSKYNLTNLYSDLFELKIYNIDSYLYPVNIRYINTYYDPHDFNDIELLESVVNLVYTNRNTKGNIVIFCSDQNQVVKLIEMLNNLEFSAIDILPAYHDLPQIEIDKLYQKGKKVVVTTSLGETTFTIDNISVIIDLMVDYKIDHSLTGGLRYVRSNISKYQANSRSHRGGKTQPVLSYRMITKDMFNKLPDKSKPEIERFPLHITVLDLIENNINPLDILYLPNIDKLVNLIYTLGLVTVNNTLTKLGTYVKNSVFGLRLAVILYKWLDNGYAAYPAIVLLSMIDIFKNPYWEYPLKTKEVLSSDYTMNLLEHDKRYFSPFEGKSDIHTYGYMWNIMREEIGDEMTMEDIILWCKNNSINYMNMLEVLTLVEHLLPEGSERGIFDTDEALEYMHPIITKVYEDKKYKLDESSQVRVRYIKNNLHYKIDSIYSINNIEASRPEYIYGLISTEIESDDINKFRTIACSYY